MLNTLTFGGISLIDYACFYDGSELWRSPQKNVEKMSVVGKNGDLIIEDGSYANLNRPFKCFIREDFRKNYPALLNRLSSVHGYARLETSEEPDIYMMAAFYDDLQPDTTQFNEKGTFTLTFDCKPQKFLKSGEMPIVVDDSFTLINPTSQIAYPLIQLVGTGSITINSSVLTLSANTSTTFIDCEIQDAYEGTINRNSDLSVSGGFPVLTDENNISFSGFTSVIIYPRWWRL